MGVVFNRWSNFLFCFHRRVFEKALERNKYEPMEDDELVKRTGKKRVGASRQRKRKASPGPGTDSPDDSVPKLLVSLVPVAVPRPALSNPHPLQDCA